MAKEILGLRADGMPVTIISDVCRGNEKIADLKMNRDIAGTIYKSNMQFIYSTKLNIDIVMKQIEHIKSHFRLFFYINIVAICPTIIEGFVLFSSKYIKERGV